VPLCLRGVLFFSLVVFLFPTTLPAQFRVMIFHAHENLGYTKARFTESMDFLQDHEYRTVSPDQLLDWMEFRSPLPLRPILLTADDNYIKVYTEMYPVLRARNQTMVNFVITDSVGREVGLHYCDWNELNEMEADGAIINESHTRSHPHLAELSIEVQYSEINDSLLAMNAYMDNKDCRYIAYPYGNYDDQVLVRCNAAGYRGGFAVGGGINYPDTNIYEIQRISGDTSTLAQFVENIGYNQLPPPPPGEGWTIDSNDVNFYCDEEYWPFAVNLNGPYGSDYRVASSDPDVTPAKWAAYLPKSGLYRLHGFWPTDGANDPQATFRIKDIHGEREVIIDQSTTGNQWTSIGVAQFSTDTPASIELIPSGTGNTIADGLWLEPVSVEMDGWVLR
jgi:peptidoglycan/xylan/chitin deacetylase (PgdA/CDA1 family)